MDGFPVYLLGQLYSCGLVSTELGFGVSTLPSSSGEAITWLELVKYIYYTKEYLDYMLHLILKKSDGCDETEMHCVPWDILRVCNFYFKVTVYYYWSAILPFFCVKSVVEIEKRSKFVCWKNLYLYQSSL